MAMAMEREWVVEEEPIAGESCSLERRRRGGLVISKETPATEGGAAAVVVGDEEESRSVYFDGARGNEVSSVVSELKSTETDHYTGENLHNGKADNLEDIHEAEENQHPNHSKVENGSFHVDSVNISKDEILETKTEKQSEGQNGTENTAKIDDPEIYLEKVIEEQETHDLFCPNCRSCITKRVILRRRKRKTLGFDHDLRPEKVRQVEPDVVAVSTDIAETSQDNEPDVFRCLSCFSFFIPTENGCNILEIFWKKDESGKLLDPSIKHSGKTSGTDGNWFTSIFKPETRRKKRDEAGVPSPVISHSDGGYLGENKRAAPVLAASETADKLENTKGIDNTEGVISPVLHYFNTYAGSRGQDDENIPPSSAPETTDIRENKKGTNSAVFAASETADTIGNAKNKDKIKGVLQPILYYFNTYAGSRGQDNETPPSEAADIRGNKNGAEEDVIKPLLVLEQPSSSEEIPPKSKNVDALSSSTTIVIPHGDVQINVDDHDLLEPRRDNGWEVLKSIVYGGLVESITSLGVVSSAAGTETSTLNVIALGLANLIGGFFVILHDLSELRNSSPANQKEDGSSRYWKLLGRRSNFGLHATVAIFSYIIFGLLPPVIYGFSFRESDNKEYKLIAVAAASLLCISLLAIAKAHVSQASSYAKTLFYNLGLGFSASGISYVAGLMIDRFLKQFGIFSPPPSPPLPPSIDLLGAVSGLSSLAYQ